MWTTPPRRNSLSCKLVRHNDIKFARLFALKNAIFDCFVAVVNPVANAISDIADHPHQATHLNTKKKFESIKFHKYMLSSIITATVRMPSRKMNASGGALCALQPP